jgi:hypothetical protein
MLTRMTTAAFHIRMYPDQPDGTPNEFLVNAKNAKEALQKAAPLFHNESWRTQGTHFEVSEERPEGGHGEPVLTESIQV